MNYDEILKPAPYELDKVAKTEYLNSALCELTRHHYNSCNTYRKMLSAQGFDLDSFEAQVKSGEKSYKDIPFLPVRLFKEYDLRSTSEEDVVKTMTSSGTTGQNRSRIY